MSICLCSSLVWYSLLVLSEIPKCGFVQVMYSSTIDPVEARFDVGSFEININSLSKNRNQQSSFLTSFTYKTAGRFPRLISCTDGQLSTETQSSYSAKEKFPSMSDFAFTVVKNPIDELSSCFRQRLSSKRRLSTFCEAFNVEAIN